MRATLITIIGPRLDHDLIFNLPRVFTNANFGDFAVEFIETVPDHSQALTGLEVRQWRVAAPLNQVQAALNNYANQARGAGIDLLVTPAELLDPGPRLIVTDVDSTLIKDEVIELLAEHAGSRARVAEVTEAAMRGDLDFTQSLVQRVATLRGLPTSVYTEVLQALRLSPGVENLCRTLVRNNDYLGVVSGGFIEIVQPLATSLGIHFVRANTLEVSNEQLTGKVTGVVIDREVKAQTLRQWAQKTNISLSRTIAVGDGANDLDMLQTAGLGVAYNAKPVVQTRADTAITGPRLDVLLATIGK